MSIEKFHIYHHNDHDGIVAAGVLYNSLKRNIPLENIKFYMIDYAMDLDFSHIDLEKERVFFLDYSFTTDHNRNEFEKLLKRRPNTESVVWIDHHKTSLDLFKEYGVLGIRDKSLCGAAWTYLFIHGLMNFINFASDYSKDFHDAPIPLFLKHIDDYDCWKKLYSNTNDFHYGLTVSSPTDEIIEDLLLNKNLNKINEIYHTGKEIQKYLAFENKEYHVDMYGFEYTLPEEHGGYKCFCMNRKGNSLMFGDKVNEYDAVIPFYYNNGKWTYSMFTIKDNVDCEATARSYGGGGHLKAAGWSIDRFIFND